MPTLIGVPAEDSFGVYMDDHIGAATTFDAIYTFLHNSYFPRVAFDPVYLSGKKTKAFMDTLELLGFEGSRSGLRASAKHRNKIQQIPVFISREELDAFLWLTPLLRIFISGREALVMKLK